MASANSNVYQSILFICTGFILLYFLFGHSIWAYASIIISLGSLLSFRVASHVYTFWHFLGKVLGGINAKIILSLIYLAVVLPVACWYRYSKQKTLQLENQNTSMWVDRHHHYNKNDLKNLW